MDNKKVSAIITTHNRPVLLKRAIGSVLEQTYKNIELIVVDDKSGIGVNDFCKNYPLTYIYIPPKESRGGNHARNVGIDAAIGEYVAFLDDDDYWLPTKIEKQVNIIEHNDCELVSCARKFEIVKGDNIEIVDSGEQDKGIKDEKREILYKIKTTTSKILVKRKALLEIGKFDEELKFWQEYDLTIRLAQRKPFFYLQEPLIVYRKDIKDSNRLTNKYFEWKDAVKYIRSKYKKQYASLTFVERLYVKNQYVSDAYQRTVSCRMKYRAFCLLMANYCFVVIFKILHLSE